MSDIVSIITLAAKAVGVPPALLLALCYQESSFKNVLPYMDGHSVSQGVCAVKAIAAKDVEPGTHPSRLIDPAVNARIAAKYLKKQINRYGNVWCGLEAYNKGHSIDCSNSINTRYVRRVRKHMEVKSWLIPLR